MGQTQKNITKSKPVKQGMPKIRTDKTGPLEYPKYIPPPKRIVEDIEARYDDTSIWEIIWWLITRPHKIIYLIYKIVQLSNRIKKMTKEKSKTTFMATAKVIIALLVTVVGFFGLDITDEIQGALLAILGSGYFIVDWVQGYFTEDKPVKEE
ncbi:hypothetical protein LCGC14_0692820 [marine sediment metagenome]|uniref:Uncharacterized protein n=1 Tax=marine sediment metagenome TaxID=412755 RepID=A0A0F9QK33_9ZZZZ